MSAPTELPVQTTAMQAEAGRAYLRSAVTLLEHAALILITAAPKDLEPVPELAARARTALDHIAAPPARVPESTTGGGLW